MADWNWRRSAILASPPGCKAMLDGDSFEARTKIAQMAQGVEMGPEPSHTPPIEARAAGALHH